MKVVLLCSVLQPNIASMLGVEGHNIGGWISGIVSGIKKYNDIELTYAAFEKVKTKNIQSKVIDNVEYYSIQYTNSNDLKEFFLNNIFDIYHLFGAENDFSNDIFPFLPLEKTLFYIQGIASEIRYHYKANCEEYFKVKFLHRIYFKLNENNMMKRAEKEIQILSKVKYITGRTEWDKAFLYKIHSNAKYFHMNESIRDIFYSSTKWNANNMNPHTIIVTQAEYPIKGTHMIVEIVRILKTYYSDVKCVICGNNLMKSNSLATKLHVSYASIIQNMIHKYNLEDNINFVGSQSAENIVKYMQISNVFLLASSIENSPNSLQEAMMIGTPSVSSYVGGVNTLVNSNNEVVTYPYDDPMRAAYEISKIFENNEYATELSLNAIKRATELTNRDNNAKVLYEIYNDIHERNKNI